MLKQIQIGIPKAKQDYAEHDSVCAAVGGSKRHQQRTKIHPRQILAKAELRRAHILG
jgi:hypothetical protein